MHNGKLVKAWLEKHPHFLFHHPPVHCSWMSQVEQWFSILLRKRLGIVNFADKPELAERLGRVCAGMEYPGLRLSLVQQVLR